MNKPTNSEFLNLPVEQQRLAIVEDALKHLNACIYEPIYGHFASLILPASTAGGDLQEALTNNSNTPCSVCALGALWLSQVRKSNGVSIRDNMIRDEAASTIKVAPRFVDINKTLSNYWPPDQIIIIEVAFEGGRGWFARVSFDPGDEGCVAFDRAMTWYTTMYPNHPNSKDALLRAILLNMKNNQGQFIPEDTTNYNETPEEVNQQTVR